MLTRPTINVRLKKNAASTAIKRVTFEETASNGKRLAFNHILDAILAADPMTDVTGIGIEDEAEAIQGTEAGAETVGAIAVETIVTGVDAAGAVTGAGIVAVTEVTAETDDAGDPPPQSPTTAGTTDAMCGVETTEGAMKIAVGTIAAEIEEETITDATTTEATGIEGTVGVDAETGEGIAAASGTTRTRVRTRKLPTILIKKTSAIRTVNLIEADLTATR